MNNDTNKPFLTIEEDFKADMELIRDITKLSEKDYSVRGLSKAGKQRLRTIVRVVNTQIKQN